MSTKSIRVHIEAQSGKAGADTFDSCVEAMSHALAPRSTGVATNASGQIAAFESPTMAIAMAMAMAMATGHCSGFKPQRSEDPEAAHARLVATRDMFERSVPKVLAAMDLAIDRAEIKIPEPEDPSLMNLWVQDDGQAVHMNRGRNPAASAASWRIIVDDLTELMRVALLPDGKAIDVHALRLLVSDHATELHASGVRNVEITGRGGGLLFTLEAPAGPGVS